jgi:hypothetical protein
MKGTMNRARNVSITLAIVVLLALLFFVRISPVTAGRKPTLSKKEVKALIASARTKEDHQKLADYYKAETERLEAEAKDHDEMAEAYKKNPSPMAVKHPEAIGEGHCHEMARRFREAATQAGELTAMHEDVAKTAQ